MTFHINDKYIETLQSKLNSLLLSKYSFDTPLRMLIKNTSSDTTIPLQPLIKHLKKSVSVDSHKKIEEDCIKEVKQFLLGIDFVESVFEEKGFLNIKFLDSIVFNPIKMAFEKNLFSLAFFESFFDSSNHSSIHDNEKARKIMVEYSQPNTHKMFHIGHMRNVALGSSLVNLFRKFGQPVVSANYFGDEGAHIYKCLWLLKERLKSEGLGLKDLNEEILMRLSAKLIYTPKNRTPEASGEEDKGEKQQTSLLEKLGEFYCYACNLLELGSLSYSPYPGFVFEKVESLTSLEEGGRSEGRSFEIVFRPQSNKNTPVKKKVYIPKEFLADISGFRTSPEKFYCLYSAKTDSLFDFSSWLPKSKNKKPSKKTSKGREIQTSVFRNYLDFRKFGCRFLNRNMNYFPKQANKSFSNENAWDGPLLLSECGRKMIIHLAYPQENFSCSVEEVLNARKSAVSSIGSSFEIDKDPDVVFAWKATREMSLNNFNEIYSWLGVDFDQVFYESSVSEKGKEIVQAGLRSGAFEESQGAIGTPLQAGYAIVLKSDGTSLYLTKDLALAKEKFNDFQIEKSIYVVDEAQTQHFRQCFEILNKLGFKQAKKCEHIAYAQVVLETGKMSSRKGNVFAFSQLRQEIEKGIVENVPNLQKEPANVDALSISSGTKKKSIEFSEKERKDIVRKVALATIKYGMLRAEKEKPIVFCLDKWLSLTGNTGPYLLYSYARICGIQRKAGITVDELECQEIPVKGKKAAEICRKIGSFWIFLVEARNKREPSYIARELFEVARMFSSWYGEKDSSIKFEKSEGKKKGKLMFLGAIKKFMEEFMKILGFELLERM